MIHDRDAHDDVLRVLDEEGAPGTVVFHCFSGDAAMARTCVDAGYVLSFAGPVTFKNAAELREAAALVPDGQLLVETDAPFLTPHPHRGRANEPYCLPWTVRGLAHVRGVPAEWVADSARRTAEAVFASAVGRGRAVAGRRGRALDVSAPPFGDHGVSRFASDCHRPLPFCHRQAGVGPLPSRAGTVVGVLPGPTASATVPALLPRTRRGLDATWSTSSRAPAARRRRRVRPSSCSLTICSRDDPPDLPGDLADLDQWLTREIPVVPRRRPAHPVLRGGPGPRTAR